MTQNIVGTTAVEQREVLVFNNIKPYTVREAVLAVSAALLAVLLTGSY